MPETGLPKAARLLYRLDGKVKNGSPMSRNKGGTRARILAAAEELSRELGPAAISLDAVAAKAGISKGGLLYHFPSKSHLLKALVADFTARFDDALREEEDSGRPNGVICAYIRKFTEERRKKLPPPSGLLAVLAENPDLLDPVREHERIFLDRIRSNASDPVLATVAFLLVQAARSMELLNTKMLNEEEMQQAIDRVLCELDRSGHEKRIRHGEADDQNQKGDPGDTPTGQS